MTFNRHINLSALFRRVAAENATVLVLLLSLAATACAPGPLVRDGVAVPPVNSSRVLLMEPDVELSELTAAGLNEPNAAWTATGRRNVEQALDAFFAERGVDLISQGATAPGPEVIQLVKLQDAVGSSILRHAYPQSIRLPSRPRFEWTLGQAASVLGRNHGADYALFLNFRDSFVSDERVAFMIAAAVFGVGVPGGQQTGFASLVDLRTGDIVWFHRLLNTTGDLRDPDSARGAVESLLTQIPL